MPICRALLMVIVVVYSAGGFVVVGGFLPLYIIPLTIGYLLIFSLRRPLILDKETSIFLLLVLAYCVWSGLVLLGVAERKRPLDFTLGLISGLGLFLFTCFTVNTFSRQVNIFRIFLIIHTLALLLATYQKITGTGFLSPSVSVHSGDQSQPAGFEGLSYLFGKNYLPIFAVAIASAVFAIKKEVVFDRRAIWTLGIISITGILISGSRSTQLALAVGLMLTAVSFRKWKIVILCVALMVGSAGYLFQTEKINLLFSEETIYGDISTSTRVLLWNIAYNMFADHPLTGVGGGNFRLYYDEYFPSQWDIQVDPAAVDPHNVFLGVLTGVGIVGFSLFLSAAFYTLFIAYKRFSDPYLAKESRLIAFATYIYLLMFAVDSNFHNYFDDNNIWLMLGVFYGGFRLSSKLVAKANG